MSLQVKKLSENAIIPTKGSPDAAGWDLYAAEDAVVAGNKHQLIKTDIAVAVPHDCYGRVAPRSGLALKNCINVLAGVIDRDYRGNVGVILINHKSENFEVRKGDRIAQLILEKISYVDIIEVAELSNTFRGEGGFGSTGTGKN